MARVEAFQCIRARFVKQAGAEQNEKNWQVERNRRTPHGKGAIHAQIANVMLDEGIVSDLIICHLTIPKHVINSFFVVLSINYKVKSVKERK